MTTYTGYQQLPGLDSFKTVGTGKMVLVIDVIDVSRTMDGGRIEAVNAALAETVITLKDIKAEYCLDVRLAIMTFTSSARWIMEPTDIDEVTLQHISTRPGYTHYGTAFRELNKVLSRDRFLAYKGKIAPPAILFLTDGEPNDSYEEDLKKLLGNRLFASASRSAILVGDAINSDKAKEAVSMFVANPEHDIVGTESSSYLIQNIQLATYHTVLGTPMDIPNNQSSDTDGSSSGSAADRTDIFGTDLPGGRDSDRDVNDALGDGMDSSGKMSSDSGDNSASGTGDAVSAGGDMLSADTDAGAGGSDPFAGGSDPFAGGNDPFTGGSDPFAGGGDPFAGGNDPFAGGSDPFAGGGDPFAGGSDPFAGGSDPFAGGSDPFADGSDLFGGGNGADPFGSGNDSFVDGNGPSLGGAVPSGDGTDPFGGRTMPF